MPSRSEKHLTASEKSFSITGVAPAISNALKEPLKIDSPLTGRTMDDHHPLLS